MSDGLQAAPSSAKGGLDAQFAQWGQRWAALSGREQRAVLLAAGVIGLALLWWVGLAPALRTLRQADAQHVVLDQQIQSMHRLQQEAVALKAQSQLSTDTARAALESSSKQHLSANTQLLVTANQAQVSLRAQGGEGLAQWLAAARANAHALPVQAKLSRVAQPRTPPSGGSGATSAAPGAPTALWDGSVTLRLP